MRESAIPEVLAGAFGAGIGAVGSFAALYGLGTVGLSGAGIASHLKHKQLKQEKERLYQEALKKQNSIIKALKDEKDADKDRIDYLTSLNILLQQAIKDLKVDLGYATS